MSQLRLQKQRYLHRPEEGTFGDCHRTCIASLLGLDRDEIPNWGVHYENGEAFDRACTDYLASQGLRRIVMPIYTENGHPEEVLEWMKCNNPNVYYLLTGSSKNGTNHVVIAKDDQIIWDPALDNSGIVAGCNYNDGPTNWFYIDIHIPNTPTPQSPSLAAELERARHALILARSTIATALKANAPDWFQTDEDIASHVTVKAIDEALPPAAPTESGDK